MSPKIQLPLKHYDEAGRVKPPVMLWLCLLVIAKSYLIFIASFTFRQDSQMLLSLFYPIKTDLYNGLMIGSGAIMCFALCGFREKIWASNWRISFLLIRPIITLSIFAESWMNILVIQHQYWQFSWVIALSFLANFFILLWLFSSKHLLIMLKDWTAETKPS